MFEQEIQVSAFWMLQAAGTFCIRVQARFLCPWLPFTVLVGCIQDFSIIFERSSCLGLENKCSLKCYGIRGQLFFLPHYQEAVLVKVQFSSIPEMWLHSRVVNSSSEDRVCSTTEEPEFPSSILWAVFWQHADCLRFSLGVQHSTFFF